MEAEHAEQTLHWLSPSLPMLGRMNCLWTYMKTDRQVTVAVDKTQGRYCGWLVHDNRRNQIQQEMYTSAHQPHRTTPMPILLCGARGGLSTVLDGIMHANITTDGTGAEADLPNLQMMLLCRQCPQSRYSQQSCTVWERHSGVRWSLSH